MATQRTTICPATGSHPPLRRWCSRSACIANVLWDMRAMAPSFERFSVSYTVSYSRSRYVERKRMARRTVPTSRHRAARLCIGVLLPAIDKKIKEFADLSGRERAGERFRNSAGRDVQPGFAGFATKACEKSFECGDNGLEVLLPEIGPYVVVDGLIDDPLLDVRCANGCGKRGLPRCYRWFLEGSSTTCGVCRPPVAIRTAIAPFARIYSVPPSA